MRLGHKQEYPKLNVFIDRNDERPIYELSIGDAVIIDPIDFEVSYESPGVARLSMVVLVSWPGEKLE